jgi:hypothetical protein
MVKIKSLSILEKAISKTIAKKNLQQWAKEGAKDIQVRTQLGKGVKGTGFSLQDHPELSEGYINKRIELKAKGKLSSFTSPKKSNLTKSGALMKSIDGRSSGNGKFEIYLRENRSSEDGISNSNLEKALRTGNYGPKGHAPKRPFFFLSKLDIKRINNKIRREFSEQFRKIKRSTIK